MKPPASKSPPASAWNNTLLLSNERSPEQSTWVTPSSLGILHLPHTYADVLTAPTGISKQRKINAEDGAYKLGLYVTSPYWIQGKALRFLILLLHLPQVGHTKRDTHNTASADLSAFKRLYAPPRGGDCLSTPNSSSRGHKSLSGQPPLCPR